MLPALIQAGYVAESGQSPTGSFWTFTQTGIKRVEELTWYSDTSRLAVRAREREAIRRAESQRAVLDQIPKASLMGGERRCLVFTGSIDSIPDLTIGGWSHTPNWWWPDDRAWIVVSELDAPSTYVGGSEALVQAILKEPQIEAVNSRRIGSTGSATGSTTWIAPDAPDSAAGTRAPISERPMAYPITWRTGWVGSAPDVAVSWTVVCLGE